MIKWLLIALFLASVLYVHFRGRARLRLSRQVALGHRGIAATQSEKHRHVGRRKPVLGQRLIDLPHQQAPGEVDHVSGRAGADELEFHSLLSN